MLAPSTLSGAPPSSSATPSSSPSSPSSSCSRSCSPACTTATTSSAALASAAAAPASLSPTLGREPPSVAGCPCSLASQMLGSAAYSPPELAW
eukprot:CAMPEP_0206515200 /NCGR_PEP_ID=MMETSP0324_2-20121206/62626_1 /ASSEMBLY_ACC=CAM_ASM_000836 /TAXON_ID=2866 /ORGANISM="Crypthecodinium cohnii, Strain Seligo" /LENGTH=92 /DNA_ID=CAMNT_0054007889 /DNA_START=672 /DNA_END=950 /DNA_ORIENTATION=-